ncbi:hypothetical protein [Fibrobacter sp. UWH4]|uniref:hypothetical protein n=1 Tax=Fibrobacter sp. UWH4 TaxID=1896210 RepID=UPI000916A79D|nr:hypothetical protein [Fibrobacter sp. UWH4]SHK61554.1 hypothetical protein SAMN05720762_102322 [Fibrobacter sp. UWH4]
MSKIIARLLVGILAALALKLISTLLLPTAITESESFDAVISLCYAACIIVPCVIYFVKAPPEKTTEGKKNFFLTTYRNDRHKKSPPAA